MNVDVIPVLESKSINALLSDLFNNHCQHPQAKQDVVVFLLQPRSRLSVQSLRLIAGHQVVVDHLLKLLLDEAVLLFILVVLMLHQEVVVGQDLVEVAAQVEELADLFRGAFQGTTQRGQFCLAVADTEVDCPTCFLAFLEFPQLPALLNLQEGKVASDHVRVDLEHCLVDLEIFAPGLAGAETLDSVKIGQQSLEGLIALVEVLEGDLDVLDQFSRGMGILSV